MKALLSAALLIVTACASSRAPFPPPFVEEPAPLATHAVVEGSSQGQASYSRSLDIEDALELALEQHPRLALARAHVDTAAARVEGAGLWTNPDLIAGVESAPFEGSTFADAEMLFGLSLEIPLSGRLGRESDVAEHEHRATAQRAQAELARVRRDVHGAFATALYAQEVARIFAQLEGITDESAALVQARLEAGDAIEEELARARMRNGSARREARRANAAWNLAANELAAAMGSPGRLILTLEGDLEVTLALPELASLLKRIEENPAMLAALAGSDAARSRIALAESAHIPNLRFDLLYRRDGAVDVDGFDAVLALPLPVFDTGRARVRESRRALVASQANERATRNELERELRDAYLEANSAFADLQMFRTDILLHAETLLDTARSRHELGDTSLDELLVARRAAALLRLEERALQRDLMQAWAELTPFLP